MANEFLTITDGEFSLQESDVKNQFHFFRNDGKVLEKADYNRPVEFYQVYLMEKMSTGEITGIVMNHFRFEVSDDGKCIRLTIMDVDENEDNSRNSIANQKQPNLFKRLLKRIFG